MPARRTRLGALDTRKCQSRSSPALMEDCGPPAARRGDWRSNARFVLNAHDLTGNRGHSRTLKRSRT